MYKFLAPTLFTLLLLLPLSLSAAVSAGVPDRALWFSKDPFFEGESITIYTLLYNSSAYQMSGTLTLSDGTSTIASKLFTVAGGGASSVVSFPWKVTGGSHVFSAMITAKEFSTKTHLVAGETVATPKTGEVKRFADADTDGDGIGNLTDADDDGDELTDAAEKTIGSNPLIVDSDGDGINDGKDLQPLLKDIVEVKPASSVATMEPATIPQAVSDRIPVSVLENATPVIGVLESYRIHNAIDGSRAIQNTLSDITAKNEVSTGGPNSAVDGWDIFREGVLSKEVIRSPFEYGKLFFELIRQFVLEHVYIYYGLLLFIVFVIIRFIWRFFN